MRVIRHQAIAHDGEAESLALGVKQVEIDTLVLINEENSLTIVSALRDVMRDTGDHDACGARHSQGPTQSSQTCPEMLPVPLGPNSFLRAPGTRRPHVIPERLCLHS